MKTFSAYFFPCALFKSKKIIPRHGIVSSKLYIDSWRGLQHDVWRFCRSGNSFVSATFVTASGCLADLTCS